MTYRLKALLSAAAIGLGLVASQAGNALADNERFVFISHAPDSDSWWNVIKNGLKNAEHDFGVKVEYRNPSSGDITDMARIIEQAASTKPTGLITTIADYDAEEPAIKAAVAKGIPVITVNSGTPEESKKLGALMHIGMSEYVAGKGAGMRAKGLGATSFLCVNTQISNGPVAERCRGFAEALGVELADSMLDAGSDPGEIYNKVKAYLTTHPKTNAILGLGPVGADATIKLLRDSGTASKFTFITFDLSPDISQAIKDGIIESAIDQQPYLQGYLPVMFLTANARYGVMPAGNVSTGPGFITKTSISLVEKLAGEYR